MMEKHEPRFSGEVSEKSHKMMSKIRGKDTSIEVALRKVLWRRGYRYRKFCDSEFFHGKDWEVLKGKLQNGKNPDYWIKKIERNIERDHEKDQELIAEGWTVIHFWGKEILKNTDECIKVIEETIFDIQIGDEEI